MTEERKTGNTEMMINLPKLSNGMLNCVKCMMDTHNVLVRKMQAALSSSLCLKGWKWIRPRASNFGYFSISCFLGV